MGFTPEHPVVADPALHAQVAEHGEARVCPDARVRRRRCQKNKRSRREHLCPHATRKAGLPLLDLLFVPLAGGARSRQRGVGQSAERATHPERAQLPREIRGILKVRVRFVLFDRERDGDGDDRPHARAEGRAAALPPRRERARGDARLVGHHAGDVHRRHDHRERVHAHGRRRQRDERVEGSADGRQRSVRPRGAAVPREPAPAEDAARGRDAQDREPEFERGGGVRDQSAKALRGDDSDVVGVESHPAQRAHEHLDAARHVRVVPVVVELGEAGGGVEDAQRRARGDCQPPRERPARARRILR
mmetsp:Transcript_6435/g.28315  ORF Transcript_6435/g.28315 Transcript_6435/m.28315 type:complete len:305 (-) Transcript_6435:366-1280(-)